MQSLLRLIWVVLVLFLSLSLNPLCYSLLPLLVVLKTTSEIPAQWAGSAYWWTDEGPCQLWSMDWNTGSVFSSSFALSCFTLSFATSFLLNIQHIHSSEAQCSVWAIMLLPRKVIYFSPPFLSFQVHNTFYFPNTENSFLFYWHTGYIILECSFAPLCWWAELGLPLLFHFFSMAEFLSVFFLICSLNDVLLLQNGICNRVRQNDCLTRPLRGLQ